MNREKPSCELRKRGFFPSQQAFVAIKELKTISAKYELLKKKITEEGRRKKKKKKKTKKNLSDPSCLFALFSVKKVFDYTTRVWCGVWDLAQFDLGDIASRFTPVSVA